MDYESSDSSSDSDEVLEEVTFLTKLDQKRLHPCTPIKKDTEQQRKEDELIGNKLDLLLTSHIEEVQKDELHQKIKDQLLNSIEQGSQECTGITFDDNLNGEFAEHIEQLEVKPLGSLNDHPTISVFNPNKFCCLFKESINPFSCGFSRSHFSKIDKVLATIKPGFLSSTDNLTPLLMSNTLPSSFHQVSSPNCIMLWLLSLLSIHPSSMVVDLIRQNMASIILSISDQRSDDSRSTQNLWCPKPIEITRILVNMGANPVYLLGPQTLYSSDLIKEHLSVENDENDSMPTRSHGRVKMENCRSIFEILTRCFRTKPDYTNDEVTLLICLIAKVSMDSSFQNLELRHILQALLSSLIECYKESEWLSVVPSLCRELSKIPQDHYCSVYLVDLMPLSVRGNYLQIRLSFLLLCSTLDPERKDEHLNLQLDSVSPSRISQLGNESPENQPNTSHIFSCFHRLIKEDINKMNSAITLLDRAVGDETNRIAQSKDELDYLTNQVKMVIKDIRDSIYTLDLSKMKDRMIIMTKKWMMMSTQCTKSVQRSIFSWVTSHASVKEEKLKDNMPSVVDDEMDL